MMNPEDIINEVHKLPLIQQKEVLDALSKGLGDQLDVEEDDDDQRLQKLLFAKGKISRIKPPYTKRIGDFVPGKIEGGPLSEQIIKDRR